MSQQQSTTRKGFLFIAVSWLIARLWWSIEISRLTILRVKQKVVISRIAFNAKSLPTCHWILDEDKIYCTGVNDEIDELFIKEMPRIVRN